MGNSAVSTTRGRDGMPDLGCDLCGAVLDALQGVRPAVAVHPLQGVMVGCNWTTLSAAGTRRRVSSGVKQGSGHSEYSVVTPCQQCASRQPLRAWGDGVQWQQPSW